MFLSCAFFSFVALCAAVQFKGVDWSSLLVEEGHGKKFSDSSGTFAPLETILISAGVNTVRQRLWTTDGDYGLKYNLMLAKRAKAAGLGVYLDLHFSDTWADPKQQSTPSAWAHFNAEDLASAVYNYTKDVANAFASTGIALEIISIGNEITSGMLWPLGQLTHTGGLFNLARFLHSASSGIRDSRSSAKIMIHLDNGWDKAAQISFYASVLKQGPLTISDFDIHGISYYPFYNSAATLSSLKASVKALTSKYGKEVMIVETDWPISCPQPSYTFPEDAKTINFSTAGQSSWLKDLAGVGASGLFYWEPAWLENPNLGSSCDNNLMFDSQGRASSSLSTFARL